MEVYRQIGKQVLRKTKVEHIAADGVPTMKLGTYKVVRQCGSEEQAKSLAEGLNDGTLKEHDDGTVSTITE
jgi:hypothetical protein